MEFQNSSPIRSILFCFMCECSRPCLFTVFERTLNVFSFRKEVFWGKKITFGEGKKLNENLL